MEKKNGKWKKVMASVRARLNVFERFEARALYKAPLSEQPAGTMGVTAASCAEITRVGSSGQTVRDGSVTAYRAAALHPRLPQKMAKSDAVLGWHTTGGW